MARERPFIAVYIMASARYGTLYIGVTSDLWLRVWQHKNGRYDSFTKKHGCTGLIWFERHDTMASAIQREKNIKHYVRKWKLKLINDDNPDWLDLAADWYDETTNRWLLDPDNP